jgi:site-specific DNA-cytosine methylase
VSIDHSPPLALRPVGLRVGSLCTGYGGLDLAVAAVLDARLAWYAETDRHAAIVLAHRFPGIANLGDIRTITWTDVAPVDVLTAGFPCQDYSECSVIPIFGLWVRTAWGRDRCSSG